VDYRLVIVVIFYMDSLVSLILIVIVMVLGKKLPWYTCEFA